MDTREMPDKREYMKNVLLGGRVYCMKEPLSTIPKARIQMKM
jgi:fatty acyl-CoA reductase